MPVFPINFESGYFDNLQISNCGLSPVNQGLEGVWTSEILTSQPGQSFGRIHFQVDNSGNYLIEVSESINGIDFTDYVAVSSNDLIDSENIRVRVKSSDTCISLAHFLLRDDALDCKFLLRSSNVKDTLYYDINFLKHMSSEVYSLLNASGRFCRMKFIINSGHIIEETQ